MRKITLILVMIFTIITYAQTDISGVITDSNGNPLPGVNVIEKGTTNGITSDFDGNYYLKVQDDATIVFSFIGFQ